MSTKEPTPRLLVRNLRRRSVPFILEKTRLLGIHF